MPEVPGIERAALEVQHSVILRNEVQVSSTTRDPRQFGQHAVGVRNRMHDVAANRKVKTTVWKTEFEYTLPLKLQSVRDPGVA